MTKEEHRTHCSQSTEPYSFNALRFLCFVLNSVVVVHNEEHTAKIVPQLTLPKLVSQILNCSHAVCFQGPGRRNIFSKLHVNFVKQGRHWLKCLSFANFDQSQRRVHLCCDEFLASFEKSSEPQSATFFLPRKHLICSFFYSPEKLLHKVPRCLMIGLQQSQLIFFP